MFNKTNYEAPQVEFVELAIEEVIAVSGEGNVGPVDEVIYPELF